MTRAQIVKQIQEKRSFLCVGLDPDISKIPSHLLKTDDPVFEFNKQIIDATHDLSIAYKPNLAFYEALGPKGWDSLAKTVEYIPDGIFKIADAKRADIGNTSNMYAKAFFEHFSFDSVTVNPYMGEDSVTPFLTHEGKWVILLAATSNKGSFDFQDLMIENGGEKLYENVIRKSAKWGTAENMMYVVGATRAETLVTVRMLVPEHFLLIPGVGAQGGSLEAVCKFGMNKQCGLIVNSSRGIIYAGNDENFGAEARKAAQALQQAMAAQLQSLF